jgi:hypothetical protein
MDSLSTIPEVTFVRINVPVPEDLKRRFRVAAATQNISMAEAGREAFEQWIERHAVTASVAELMNNGS